MKCEKCNSEWNSSRSILVCPFCGESLVQFERKKPEEILCFIVDEYGVDVLKDKRLLLSYFSDYAPFLTKEYRLLKNCCGTDFISILLTGNSSKASREIVIKKATSILMDECFMSKEYASNVVGWITVALKWDSDEVIVYNQVEGQNEPESETEITKEQDHIQGKSNNVGYKRVFDFLAAAELDVELTGVKAQHLSKLTKMGIPVPQGIIINSKENTNYYENMSKLGDELKAEVKSEILKLEEITGKRYGDELNPLILSLCVSPTVKMPGLIDDVICIGFNEKVTEQFADYMGKEWAWSTYCQFIVRFMDQVLEIPKKYIEEAISEYWQKTKGLTESGLNNQSVIPNADDYKSIVHLLIKKYKEWTFDEFPQEPYDQLFLAIDAAYKMWDSPRARIYRRDNKIPFSAGQAICIQQMVFGNFNEKSGVGKKYVSDESQNVYMQKSLSLNISRDFGLNTIPLLSKPPESSQKMLDLMIRTISNNFVNVIAVLYTIYDGFRVYINAIES
ncbi:PEP/pyruvate-binding domain-containing protein [Ruminococcus sp. zg-924]|uniref:PEP/pyruvate-binding domain-containing protein n=1 Tax=Ruminococcus sp. zg-924 TaxID=2678505 RepID=UPI00210A967E|nr:PEP/pyruvate-binding domain-containing protein [Ruminococcus sp. zg-924]MCQ4022823.1 hypothetical protein [Ruminococcus sp. zg-924]